MNVDSDTMAIVLDLGDRENVAFRPTLALKAKWSRRFSEGIPSPFLLELCECLTTEGGRLCNQDM